MLRKIGTTGVEVFAIGLGAMPLSIADRPSENQSIKVIHAALDAGVSLIDTANVYCLNEHDMGHNEKLIARALSLWPGKNKIYVATKGGLMRPGGAWEANGSPDQLRKACEQSLRDLGVEQIFLYQLHAPDEKISFEQQIATLQRLREEGKIVHIGISNVDAREIKAAQKITRIETVQNKCNPACQGDFFDGVIETCREFDMTYIAYSPVGGGRFHHDLASNSILMNIAAKYKVSSYQVMLAWALAKDEIIVPIPGASRIASIIDSAKAVGLSLQPDDIEAIDDI